jgi:hypothetical protein
MSVIKKIESATRKHKANTTGVKSKKKKSKQKRQGTLGENERNEPLLNLLLYLYLFEMCPNG